MRLFSTLVLVLLLFPLQVIAACSGTSVDGTTPITVVESTTYCVTGDNLAVGDYDLFTGSADSVTIDFQTFQLGHATTSTSREIINLSGDEIVITGDAAGAGTLGSANILSGIATVTGVTFENDDAVAAVPLNITGGVTTLSRCEINVSGTSIGYAFRVTAGSLVASDCLFRHLGVQDICRIDAGADVDIRGSTFVGSGNTASELFYSRQATTETCIISGNIFKNFSAARVWFFTTSDFYFGLTGGINTYNNNCLIRDDANADLISPGTDDMNNIPGTGNVSVDPTFTTDTVAGADSLTAGSPMENGSLPAYSGATDYYGTTRHATSPTIGAFDFGTSDATGACCTGGTCSIATSTACTGGGGTYQGDATVCSPDPCATGGDQRVCCFKSSTVLIGPGDLPQYNCAVVTQADCYTAAYPGGWWFPGETSCDPNPCIGAPVPTRPAGFQNSMNFALVMENQPRFRRLFTLADSVRIEQEYRLGGAKSNLFASLEARVASGGSPYYDAGNPGSIKDNPDALMTMMVMSIATDNSTWWDYTLAALELHLDAITGPGTSVFTENNYYIAHVLLDWYGDWLTDTQLENFRTNEWFEHMQITEAEATGQDSREQKDMPDFGKSIFYTLFGEMWENAGSIAPVFIGLESTDTWKAELTQGVMNTIIERLRGWDAADSLTGDFRYRGSHWSAIMELLPTGVGYKGDRHYEPKRDQWVTYTAWTFWKYGLTDEWPEISPYIEGRAESYFLHRKPDGIMSQIGTGASILPGNRNFDSLAMINQRYPNTDGGRQALRLLEQGPQPGWGSAAEPYQYALTAMLWIQDGNSSLPMTVAADGSGVYRSGDSDGVITLGDGVPIYAQMVVRGDETFDFGVDGFYSRMVLQQFYASDTWVGPESFELYFNGPQIGRGCYYGALEGAQWTQWPPASSFSISQSTLWIGEPTYAASPDSAWNFSYRWGTQSSGWLGDGYMNDVRFPGQPPRIEEWEDIDVSATSRYIPNRWTQTAGPVLVDGLPITFDLSVTDPEIAWYGLNTTRDVERYEFVVAYLGGGSGHEVLRKRMATITAGQGDRDMVNNLVLPLSTSGPTMETSLFDTPEADHIFRHDASGSGFELAMTNLVTNTVNVSTHLEGVTYDSRLEYWVDIDTDADTLRHVKVGGLGVADAESHEQWHFLDMRDMVASGENLVIPNGSGLHEFPKAYQDVSFYQIGDWRFQTHAYQASYLNILEYFNLGTPAATDLDEVPESVTGANLQGIHLNEHNWNVVIPDETDWTSISYTSPAGTDIDHIVAWGDGATSYDVFVDGDFSQNVTPSDNILTFVDAGGLIIITSAAGGTGACCDGITCTIEEGTACTAGGRDYQGDGTICTPNPCLAGTVGACCIPPPPTLPVTGQRGPGDCYVTDETACGIAGDLYVGDGTVCDPNPCNQPTGACCADDGSCDNVTESLCTSRGETYQGDGAVCSPSPCKQPGACCASDGSCGVVQESACTTGYQGDGSVCSPNPCPQPGACCEPDGFCSFIPVTDCFFNFLGEGVICSPNPCPDPGACCETNGICTVILETVCDQLSGAIFQGEETVCSPNPCPQPGACCNEVVCTVVLLVDCTGVFQGEGTDCDPNPCVETATGACCLPTELCVLMTQADCATASGTYIGDGTGCEPTPCNPTDTGEQDGRRHGFGPNSGGTMMGGPR